jgi:hypothetical protein
MERTNVEGYQSPYHTAGRAAPNAVQRCVDACVGAIIRNRQRLGESRPGERGLRHPYGFIAKILTDGANGLRDVGKLYQAEMDREDAAALRSSRRAAK